jgi:hypothetical protein
MEALVAHRLRAFVYTVELPNVTTPELTIARWPKSIGAPTRLKRPTLQRRSRDFADFCSKTDS